MEREELYRRLVDLYAGRELPEEMVQELESLALEDSDLAADMMAMRTTVDQLRDLPAPEFSQESHDRILMRLMAQGIDLEPCTPPPAHIQYRLPIAT